MSRLTELLRQAQKVDPQLSADLEAEIAALTKRRSFAERFAGDFRRIESVAETNGRLRVLDITKTSVRQAIRDARSAKALYESDLASDY